jgi:RimJ/RimL family protein N-acetyltransferase
MAAFTREDPTDRAAFDAHYRRVRANEQIMLRAIEEDGKLVGMIASFAVGGDRDVTYWIDPGRWARGIASEAVRLSITTEQQSPLYARAAAHNLGSRKCWTYRLHQGWGGDLLGCRHRQRRQRVHRQTGLIAACPVGDRR